MVNSPRFKETHHNLSLIPSPNSSSSSSTTSSNGLHHHHHHHPPPKSPVPITRSEPNSPYPTTFVQADTTSFKQVVQMLTGSVETAKPPSGPSPARPESRNHSIPPIKNGHMKEKSKLYERRNSLKNFKISPLAPGLVNNNNKPGFSGGYSGSPRLITPEILSPSLLDFPSLALSPVTPLIPDPFNRSPHSQSGLSTSNNANLNMDAEDKAIAKKGFYLHPSPASTPREEEEAAEPRLLPLFPVTSPRVSGSSSD